MKKSIYLTGIAVFALTVLLTGFSANSKAALVETGLFNATDGLLISDTVNRREWLDVTATVGISANQALSTYTGYGFRLATALDVVQLYTEAGIPDILDFGASASHTQLAFAANWSGVTLLLNLMNHTEAAFGNNMWVHGFINEVDSYGNLHLARFTDYNGSKGNLAGAHINTNGYWNPDIGNASIGSFLVRDVSAVPEASTLLLFGSGLLGLAGAGGIGYVRRRFAI